MFKRATELSGLIGGFLWLASWAISAYYGFSESTGYGWAFLITGITGPIAGIATGLVWGNWMAFILGAVGWLFIAISPDLLKESNQRLTTNVGRGPCGRYAAWLEAERKREQAELLANPPWRVQVKS